MLREIKCKRTEEKEINAFVKQERDKHDGTERRVRNASGGHRRGCHAWDGRVAIIPA